jgi:hypothetical protein
MLTLILLTCRIWWAPNNASRWQMGFNLTFKGLKRFGWAPFKICCYKGITTKKWVSCWLLRVPKSYLPLWAQSNIKCSSETGFMCRREQQTDCLEGEGGSRRQDEAFTTRLTSGHDAEVGLDTKTIQLSDHQPSHHSNWLLLPRRLVRKSWKVVAFPDILKKIK